MLLGECGSCYVIASLSVYNSRMKIKSKNKLNPNLSIEGALSCNNFNQGILKNEYNKKIILLF